MVGQSKRDLLFLVLAGFFVTNAVVAELIGGKLILVGPFTLSIGTVPWPVVFVATDLINEYFGVKGVRRLTLLTLCLIVYAFLVLAASMAIPAAGFSPVSDKAFREVFGQSLWIIVGSLTAFAIGQLVDAGVFWYFRDRTGSRMLWLRATGSTAVSQLIDTFVVAGIAFLLPGKLSLSAYLSVCLASYTFKLIIAIGATPIIYLVHTVIDRLLGDEAEALIAEAGAAQALGEE